MLSQSEAVELARLMRQREQYRCRGREDPEQAVAAVRASLIAAFGEADFTAAAGSTDAESV
jgi:hypothetical protein